jgi:hypothetical protein
MAEVFRGNVLFQTRFVNFGNAKVRENFKKKMKQFFTCDTVHFQILTRGGYKRSPERG